MTTRFITYGTPKGQPRPRAFAMHGKVRVYDPATAEGWKSAVAEAARPFLPPSPFEGPVEVELGFMFARPASHLRVDGSLRPSARVHHLGKPDLDNLAKAVLDALTALGFWRDDAQVIRLLVTKAYGPRAGCRIQLSAQ